MLNIRLKTILNLTSLFRSAINKIGLKCFVLDVVIKLVITKSGRLMIKEKIERKLKLSHNILL